VTRRHRTLAAVAALLAAGPAPAGAATRYATSPAIEPDRCAVAWVIRHFVEPAATFEFHPEDGMPEGVTLFDLPDAELRRDARRAAVEVLIERERITDPFVLHLGRMVHDVEIRAWARPADAPSVAFERRVMEPILAAPDLRSGLAACFQVLDQLEKEQRSS
jgi:hypothetical protein